MRLTSPSSVADQWMFDEPPPGLAGFFSEDFGSYRLEGRVLLSSDSVWPSTLSIHGARSDYTKLNPLLYGLQCRGVGSLSFNLSGHSRCASICAHDTSLEANLSEARRFFSGLHGSSRTVIGHSMGGALAMKIAAAHPTLVAKIVLLCPAVYADAAYKLNFGPPFKAAISSPYSFLSSDTFDFLRQFSGRMMLIIGQHDALSAQQFGKIAGTAAGSVMVTGAIRYSAIPMEVIDGIKDAVPAGRLETLVLPGCDHRISTWLRHNPAAAANLAARVARFIANQ